MSDSQQTPQSSSVELDSGSTNTTPVTKFDTLTDLQKSFTSFWGEAKKAQSDAIGSLWEACPEDDDALPPSVRPVLDHMDFYLERMKGLYGGNNELFALKREAEMWSGEEGPVSAGTERLLQDGDDQDSSIIPSNSTMVVPVPLSVAITNALRCLETFSAEHAVLSAKHWACSSDGTLDGDSNAIATWWNTKVSSMNPFPHKQVCGCVTWENRSCNDYGDKVFTQEEIVKEKERLTALASEADEQEKKLRRVAPWVNVTTGTVEEEKDEDSDEDEFFDAITDQERL